MDSSNDRVRLAVATCSAFPALAQDDHGLLTAAAQAGVEARPVVWDQTAPQTLLQDVVLVRSTWDYHLQPQRFVTWLRALEAQGTPVFNPVPLLCWNLDKRYLRTLAQRGVPVVETHWVEDDAGVSSLRAWLQGRGDVVVKPAVGANASGARRFAAREVAEVTAYARELLAGGAVMVQPFVDAVKTEGEWGAVFVDGVFSHAVLKRPALADYRVQETHGGTSEVRAPSADVLRMSQHVLAALEEPPLYARVDVVVDAGQPRLMELEVVEPSLFLAGAPAAAPALVAALLRRVGVSTPRGSKARVNRSL